jgi:hypothetical protein
VDKKNRKGRFTYTEKEKGREGERERKRGRVRERERERERERVSERARGGSIKVRRGDCQAQSARAFQNENKRKSRLNYRKTVDNVSGSRRTVVSTHRDLILTLKIGPAPSSSFPS